MVRLVHAEFDAFDAALRPVHGRRVLLARQVRDWRLRTVELPEITLMVGRAGAASIFSAAAARGTFSAVVPLSRFEDVRINGRTCNRNTLAWLAPEQMFHMDSKQPASWVSVTMSADALMSWLSSHEDEVNLPSLNQNMVRIATSPPVGLMRLLRRLLQVDEQRVDAFTSDAAREAALEVRDAVFCALLPLHDQSHIGRPAICRAQIVERALAFMESAADEPIHTDDLCRATGVSERTLRNVFCAHFGMAPHKYLMIRRLNSIRDAFRAARPGATVSSICADFGIWDCGRFAHQFHELFGMQPSKYLNVARLEMRH